MNCSNCQTIAKTKLTKTGKPRLPKGWKQIGDTTTLCGACKRATFRMRSIVLPIAAPVGVTYPLPRKLDWAQLESKLVPAFRISTQVANWAIRELVKADDIWNIETTTTSEKSKPRLYVLLKKQVRKEFSRGSLSGILQMVEAKYRTLRKDIINGSASVPTFRYPHPYVLRAQDWEARWFSDADHAPVISFPLMGERVECRLAGGIRFRRGHQAFAQILSGEAIRGDLMIYARGKDLLAKMSLMLPKVSASANTKKNSMVLMTDKESFLVAQIGGADVWRVNADHVFRWIAEHQKRLHRISDDKKFERRSGAKTDLDAKVTSLCEKHGNRLDSFVKMAAAFVVKFAVRRTNARTQESNSQVLIMKDSAKTEQHHRSLRIFRQIRRMERRSEKQSTKEELSRFFSAQQIIAATKRLNEHKHSTNQD